MYMTDNEFTIKFITNTVSASDNESKEFIKNERWLWIKEEKTYISAILK